MARACGAEGRLRSRARCGGLSFPSLRRRTRFGSLHGSLAWSGQCNERALPSSEIPVPQRMTSLGRSLDPEGKRNPTQLPSGQRFDGSTPAFRRLKGGVRQGCWRQELRQVHKEQPPMRHLFQNDSKEDLAGRFALLTPYQQRV